MIVGVGVCVTVAVTVAVGDSVGVTEGISNLGVVATTGGVTTAVASASIGDSVPIGLIAAGDAIQLVKTSSNSNTAVDNLISEINRIIREI